MKVSWNQIVFLNGMILFMAFGCASSPDSDVDVSFNNDTIIAPSKNLPLRAQDYHQQQTGFASQLPLGIGGRFDLVLSDTAEDVSSFYDSYVSSLRSGKIFARTPYQMDYSILPRRGAAFGTNRDVLDLKSVSIRSDYKLQIGVTRRFNNFGDFLNPGFWAATGKFAPKTPPKKTVPDPLVHTLGDPDYNWEGSAEAPFDLDALIEEEAGLLSPEPANDSIIQPTP